MNNKLEQALALGEEGFFVFRLRPNDKKPLHGWQEEATTDPDEITALFDNDRDFNIGIFTEKFGTDNHALAVVDVDTKDGKRGNETMRELDALGYDFPPTRTITTASGGRHLIYHYPFSLRSGANRIGQHVDLKSHGGYIVAEGSTINNTPYRLSDNHPVAQAPEWIRDKAGRAADKLNGANAPHNFTDSDQAIERAIDYLTHQAESAVKGAGRNDTFYKTAAYLRDLDLAEPTALELLWKYYNPRCQPGYEFDRLEIVTSNAYRYANSTPGTLSPHAVFDPIPDDPKSEKKIRQLYYKWFETITAPLDYPQLIENLLDQNAMSVLYGESNTGKTFVALDLAYHVATGQPWGNRRTTQGGVLYIAAEGGRSAENRFTALRQHYQPTTPPPLALMPCPINLFNSKKQLQEIITLIRQAEKEKEPIRLLIIDTLSRALAGGNENSSEDMTAFIDSVDVIRHQTQTHVLIVHHSGKDTSKGARGHSSLRAATDTELEIIGNTLTVRKQRDMEFAKPQGFDLRTLTIGTNHYGQPTTSCVVELVDAEARDDFNQTNRLEHRDLIALLALQNCKTGRQLRGRNHVVEQKAWGQCCKDFDITMIPGAVPFPKSDESFRKAFLRVRDRLVAFDRVEEVEEKQWVAKLSGHPVPDGTEAVSGTGRDGTGV